MANNSFITDIFKSEEAQLILKNKYVLFIGDSGKIFCVFIFFQLKIHEIFYLTISNNTILKLYEECIKIQLNFFKLINTCSIIN